MTDYIQVPVDLLSELAESLACELDARYPASVRYYESQDRKYQAEMEPVLTARRIIAAAPDHIADTRKMVASDVQGEPVALAASAQKPVGYVSQVFLDGKWSLDHIAKSDEGQISRTIPVFAKPPQPAEQQQPCRQSPPDDPLGGLEHRADGEANFHTLSRPTGSWVARIQFNGEPSRDDLIQCLLATRGQSEGVAADAILSMFYTAPQPAEQQPDVAGLVDALEGALNGRPLDTEFWDRCEQFIAAHRKGTWRE